MISDLTVLSSMDDCVPLPEIRVVVLGDARVGKTALLRQYVHHEGPAPSESYESTLLDSYTHVEYCGMQPYRIIFTDCSSAPSFREHRAAYLSRCDVVILVYSVQQRDTLLNLPHWMEEVTTVRGSSRPVGARSKSSDFGKIPIFIVGTRYGEHSPSEANNQTSMEEAERVTRECLYSAGYFVEDDPTHAKWDPRVRVERAKRAHHPQEARKGTRAMQSLRPFYDLLSKLFRSSVDGEASHVAAQKSLPHDEVAAAHEHKSMACSVNADNFLSSAKSPETLLQLNPDSANIDFISSGGTSSLSIPCGASVNFPLFQLSNTNGEAVDMAVRASLLLHLWLRQQKSLDAALSWTRSTRSSSSGSSSSSHSSSSNAAGTRTTDAASDSAAAASQSISVSPPVLPAALQAPRVSASSHKPCSRSFSRAPLPSIILLYSVCLSSFGGGGSTAGPTFRHSRSVSDVGQTVDTSPRAPNKSPLTPNVAHPFRNGACSYPGASGIDVAAGAANVPRATGEVVACTAAPLRLGNVTERSSWCSMTCDSLAGENKGESSTHWSSSNAPPPGAASPATPPKLGLSPTSGALIHLGGLMQVSASVNVSSIKSPGATRPNAVYEEEASGDASNVVEVSSSSSPLAGAVDGVGGELSTTSGPMMHNGTFLVTVPSVAVRSSRDGAAGGDVFAASLAPISRVRREVDGVEKFDSAGTDSLDCRQTRSDSLVKKCSMECAPKGGLSLSSMSQRNAKDSCAMSLAVVRTPSVDTLTSPVYTTNNYSGVPFPNRSPPGKNIVSSSTNSHTAPATAAVAPKSEATSTKSQRQSAKARAPMSSSLLLSSTSVVCETTSSRLESLRLKRDGKAQSTDMIFSEQSGTSVTLLNTSAHQPKQEAAQCRMRGCAAM